MTDRSAPRLLLLNVPVVRACEPPAGLWQLAAAVAGVGVGVRVLDLNLEGQLHLLQTPPLATDTWTRRAARDGVGHLAALRERFIAADPPAAAPEHGSAFAHFDTYVRRVGDLERLLAKAATGGWHLGLANLEHERWLPTRSVDLRAAAAEPEANPFARLFAARLRAVLGEFAPTHVGVSLNYLSQALSAFAILGWLRRERPDIQRIVGGGLITSWSRRPGGPERFAELIDHWIPGAGEEPLCALLTRGGASGAVTTHVSTMPTESENDCGLSPDQYLSPGPVLPFSAASGCFWRRCAFCPEVAEGNPFVPLPPAQVAATLRSRVAAERPVLLHLLDNALSPALLQALAAAPPGAPWYGFARFGAPLNEPGFAEALARSGCIMLQLGLESGDPDVLAAMRKGIDLTDAAATLAALHAAGIGTYVYLLFGTPSEDRAAAERTLAFVRTQAAHIDFLNVAIFNLPAHGDEAVTLATRPFNDGDLSLYLDFTHPLGWDRRTVRRWLDTVFKRDPCIAAILQRDPPVFTSNHAPFFLLHGRARRGVGDRG